MSKQVYTQSFGVCVGAFASAGLVTVNPKCDLLTFTCKSGWHYPMNAEEMEAAKPVPIHPYIDIGDCIRYTTYHFYRPEEAPSADMKSLDDPGSDMLTLDGAFKRGSSIGL